MSIKYYKSKSTLFIPQLKASLPSGTVFALNLENNNIEVNGVSFPLDRNISLFIQHGFFAEVSEEELKAEQEAASMAAVPMQAGNELPLMHISKKTIDLPEMYNKGGNLAKSEYPLQQGQFTAENNYGLKGIVKMESTSHRLSLDGKPITASAEESNITTLNDGPSFVKPSADKIAEARAYAEARKQQRLEQATKLQTEMNANGISRPLNNAEFSAVLTSDNNKAADKTPLDSPVAVIPVAEKIEVLAPKPVKEAEAKVPEETVSAEPSKKARRKPKADANAKPVAEEDKPKAKPKAKPRKRAAAKNKEEGKDKDKE